MFTINENNAKETACYYSSLDYTFLYFTNLVGYQVQILELSGPNGNVINNLTIGGNKLISSYRYETNYAKIVTIPIEPVNAISMHVIANSECSGNIFLLTAPLSRFDSTKFANSDLKNSCIFFGSQNVITTIFNSIGHDITIFKSDGSTRAFSNYYAESDVPIEQFVKVNDVSTGNLFIYTSNFQPYNDTFYYNNFTNQYGATYITNDNNNHQQEEESASTFGNSNMILIICVAVACCAVVTIGGVLYYFKSNHNKYTKIPQEFL